MKITFKWIGGATWTLSTGDLSIACDPVLCDQGTVQNYRYFTSVRLNDPLYADNEFSDIDLWLLTHGHEDHLDKPGIGKLSPRSTIISHHSAKGKLDGAGLKNYTVLAWDGAWEGRIKGYEVSIKAVPAIHGRFRFLGKIVGNNNGYYGTIRKGGDSFTFYVTGDDVFNRERAARLAPVDLVIANAGAAHVGRGIMSFLIGRITSSSRDIEKLCRVMHPAALIPVHWGTFSHYTDGPPRFRKGLPVKVLAVGQTTELFF